MPTLDEFAAQLQGLAPQQPAPGAGMPPAQPTQPAQAPGLAPSAPASVPGYVSPFGPRIESERIKERDPVTGQWVEKIVPYQVGTTREAGPAYQPSSIQTFEEAKTEATQIARHALAFGQIPRILNMPAAEVLQERHTYKHPTAARYLEENAPWARGIAKALTLPYGRKDPLLEAYYSKIGQLNAKLLKPYLGGRPSVWLTNYVKEHFPDPSYPADANNGRILAMLHSGVLDNLVKESIRWDAEGLTIGERQDIVGTMATKSMTWDEALSEVRGRVLTGIFDAADPRNQGMVPSD